MVRAVAALNGFADESVPVELKLHLDHVVYPMGTLIGTLNIDTSLSDSRILIALMGFVQNTLPKIAEADGVVPESEDVTFDISAMSERDVEYLLKQVELIRQLGEKLKNDKKSSMITVNAVANKDITASNPLDVSDLRIELSFDE